MKYLIKEKQKSTTIKAKQQTAWLKNKPFSIDALSTIWRFITTNLMVIREYKVNNNIIWRLILPVQSFLNKLKPPIMHWRRESQRNW